MNTDRRQPAGADQEIDAYRRLLELLSADYTAVATLPDDIPGNEVVAAVGRLSLAAEAADSQVNDRVYAVLLWPTIRKGLGPLAPACFAAGSYEPLVEQTLRIGDRHETAPLRALQAAASSARPIPLAVLRGEFEEALCFLRGA